MTPRDHQENWAYIYGNSHSNYDFYQYLSDKAMGGFDNIAGSEHSEYLPITYFSSHTMEEFLENGVGESVHDPADHAFQPPRIQQSELSAPTGTSGWIELSIDPRPNGGRASIHPPEVEVDYWDDASMSSTNHGQPQQYLQPHAGPQHEYGFSITDEHQYYASLHGANPGKLSCSQSSSQ